MALDDRLQQEFIDRADLSSYTWKNRRRMAWGAFVSILIVTGACLFYVEETRLERLETVVTWFYMAMASIVGAYMGFATYASVKGGDDPYQVAAPQDQSPPESSVSPDVPEDEAPSRRRKASMRGFSVE